MTGVIKKNEREQRDKKATGVRSSFILARGDLSDETIFRVRTSDKKEKLSFKD